MFSNSDAIIVTSCTSRKKITGEIVTLRENENVTTVQELVRTWITSIAVAQRREVVLSLYQGRSFSEAKHANKAAGGQLYVASAGHGIVCADESLPSYDLTVVASPSNPLHLMLARLGKTSADWWKTLTGEFKCPRSLAALMNTPSWEARTVLLAMPSVYLAMLSDDLASLNDQQVARLRIITSESAAARLPMRLRAVALPYDERLEGNVSYAGTRNDFAQRALHHFIVELKGHTQPLHIARERVALAMNASIKPQWPQRERKTNDDIEKLLQKNWHRHNGSQSALLRWLRDDQLVSCEQGRFRLLWQRVQLKIKAIEIGCNDKA